MSAAEILLSVFGFFLFQLLIGAIWSSIFGMGSLRKEMKKTNAYLREIAILQGLSHKDTNRIEQGWVRSSIAASIQDKGQENFSPRQKELQEKYHNGEISLETYKIEFTK